MIYTLIAALPFALILGGIIGYFVGRFKVELLDKIRTLEGQSREPIPEPEKPKVTGGAYQPPHATSPVPDKKRNAGLVESKTPQQLEWENRQEIDNLTAAN